MKYYRVSEVSLKALVYASQEIDLLDAAGVDNWSYWGEVPYPTDEEVEGEMSMYEEIEMTPDPEWLFANQALIQAGAEAELAEELD